MPKVTGPLLSIEARGSVGRCLTFSKRRYGQQVRWQRKQKDVITSGRTAQRSKFLLGLDLWRALPDNEKEYWQTLSNFLELYL